MAHARLADQLGVALTRLTNLLREAVLPAGMNSAQARTLLALHDAGPQRVTDLARLDHLKQPTMSVVLIRMERLGWVRRVEDKGDLRAVIVRLTPAGDRIASQLIAARTTVLRSCLETLSVTDRAAVAAALPALRKLSSRRDSAREARFTGRATRLVRQSSVSSCSNRALRRCSRPATGPDAGCSTIAITRAAMKRPTRTGCPVRVSSATSTTPRAVVTSTRRPARVAEISKVRALPVPASTITSTMSPIIRPL